MKKFFEFAWGTVLATVLVALGVSLILSFMRLAGHDMNSKEKTPCVALYIDKLEPVISTRWFCEVSK